MLRLRWHPEALAVCRLDSTVAIPDWFLAAERRGPLTCAARSRDELSLIAVADAVPETVVAEGDFVACEVVGPLNFNLVGVLHRLLAPLAAGGIPVLTVSTHDTDWLLIRRSHSARAALALGTVAVMENAPPE